MVTIIIIIVTSMNIQVCGLFYIAIIGSESHVSLRVNLSDCVVGLSLLIVFGLLLGGLVLAFREFVSAVETLVFTATLLLIHILVPKPWAGIISL